MIAQSLKYFTRFFQGSIVLLMITTLGCIFYFWNQGFIDGSRSQDLHQASFLLESIINKKQFQEVKELINQENPKAALKKVESLEEELKTVDKQVSISEFESLNENIQKLKSASARLISFSKSEQVVSVFSKKLDSFNEFVRVNRWRTLTRMGDRVSTLVSGHLNKSKLENLANTILKDFEQMTSITENSILERKDKSEIVSRISNLKIEMQMLKDYASQKNKFEAQYNRTSKSLKQWFDEVSPAITLSKLEVQEVGRYYVMAMLGILILLSCVFFSSFFFSAWFSKRENQKLEARLEEIVTEGFVGGDRTQFRDLSQGFQKYAFKMMTYIDKRMSFGSIFQDSLPLSSILLDQNLKVAWANQQFCSTWEISEDEIKKDYMSWDYLNKLTNIGSDDPVMEALKNDVAGIYQVQIKPHDEAEVRPFEMFVSPVRYKNEKRIMLFFYDLTNLEATISEQAKSILNPVRESINLLKSGRFSRDEQLEYEFKIADLNELYENFSALNDQINNNDLESRREISELEEQIQMLQESLNEIISRNDENLALSRGNIDSLKIFKENVIALSELTQKLNRSALKGSDVIHTNLAALKGAVSKLDGTKAALEEVFGGLPNLEVAKDDIKNEKVAIQELRAKLGHEISQMGVVLKNAEDMKEQSKVARTLDKMKLSFQQCNERSESLDKKLAHLDILMSKTQMVLNAGEQKIRQVNSQFEQQQTVFAEQEIKVLQKLNFGSRESHEMYEEEIISALQNIFKGTKENLKLFAEIRAEGRSVLSIEKDEITRPDFEENRAIS